MNELFDKKVNAQKESLKNILRGSHQLPQAHEKVCDENESRIRKKRHARNNVIDGRGEFIRRLWKGHAMDINKLQVDDS